MNLVTHPPLLSPRLRQGNDGTRRYLSPSKLRLSA